MSAITSPRRLGIGTAVLSLALVANATAQTPPGTSGTREPEASSAQAPVEPGGDEEPVTQSPQGSPLFHVAAYFQAGYDVFAATNTFKAALGESGGTVLGAGASITHRSGIFFQVDATKFKGDGERAFLFNGQVYPLGIPLHVETLPIEFTWGYKFFVNPRRTAPPDATEAPQKPAVEPARPRAEEATPPPEPEEAETVEEVPIRRPMGGMRPYVGGGIGIVKYKETSDFASGSDNVDESYTSYHVMGGIEIPVWKIVGTAFEVNYRWVKDAFGVAGLSKEYGEDDLGGLSFRFKVTVGR